MSDPNYAEFGVIFPDPDPKFAAEFTLDRDWDAPLLPSQMPWKIGLRGRGQAIRGRGVRVQGSQSPG
jgi:hypothetical protein